MFSLNFFKLCKILADHNQCIQWYKEHNLLASSIKCPRENCNNALTWTRASSRDEYEWRCSRRKRNDMASMHQNSWFSGSRLSIEKVLALTYAWDWIWRRKSKEKRPNDTMKVSNNFISLRLHIQNWYNSRWPDQQFIANHKQPMLRPKTLFFKHF